MPIRVHTIVISVQHSDEISLDELREEVLEKVINIVIPKKYLDKDTVIHINPCGPFVIGGPMVSRHKCSCLAFPDEMIIDIKLFSLFRAMLALQVEKSLLTHTVAGELMVAELFRERILPKLIDLLLMLLVG